MPERKVSIVIAARDRASKMFGRVASSATQAFSKIGTIGAVGAAGGIVALTFATRNAMATIDELAKTSDKLGVSTEKLAGLQLAAGLTGVKVAQLNTGLQRMTRRVAEAAQGSGEAKAAIAELGLDARRLVSLSPDEQFAAIGNALEKVGSQSDRVRLGFKLFDAEGVGLINTLRGGSEQLAQYQREAERLGLAVSRVDAAAIEKANDAISLMGASLAGVVRTIAVAVAPTVKWMADQITKSVQISKRAIGELGDRFRAEFAAASAVVTNLSLSWQLGMANMKVRASTAADTVKWAWGNTIEFLATVFGNTLAIVRTTYQNAGIIIGNAVEHWRAVLGAFGDFTLRLFGNMMQAVRNVTWNIWQLFRATFDAIATQSLDPFRNIVFASLNEGMRSLTEPLREIMGDLAKGTKSVHLVEFKAAAREVSDKTRQLIEARDQIEAQFDQAVGQQIRAAIEVVEREAGPTKPAAPGLVNINTPAAAAPEARGGVEGLGISARFLGLADRFRADQSREDRAIRAAERTAKASERAAAAAEATVEKFGDPAPVKLVKLQ